MCVHRDSIMQNVEMAIFNKEVALALFDVEGAFDKSSTNNMCEALQARGVADQLVSWMISSNRQFGYWRLLQGDEDEILKRSTSHLCCGAL